MNIAALVAKVGAAVEAARWARIDLPPQATDAFRGVVAGAWVISVVAWKDDAGVERCDGVATDATGMLIRLIPDQSKHAVALARKACAVN